jgi:histone deacetylase 1/2
MKSLENEMISAGKALEDEDMVSYILAGLKDDSYTGLVAAILARTEPIMVSELYSQLLSYESRQQMLRGISQSSVNAATRGGHGRFGGRGGGGRGDQGRGHPQGGGNGGQGGYHNGGNGGGYHNGGNHGRGRGNYNNNGRGRGNNNHGGGDRPRCQLCNVSGHTIMNCWYRFDQDFVPRERTAANVNYNNNGGGGWNIDTGATDHITSELERLHAHERYHGNDQVHAANGVGMNISHIGNSIIPTHDQNIHLKDVLHVPDATKNLASAHRLTRDNNAFIEIHPEFFCIKDQVTRKVLLDGPCQDGLYPVPESSSFSPSSKQAYGVFKPSHHRWHSRLGHPASSIVQRVISHNKLPCSSENNESVCEACQKAKSHQLPYSRSTSVSHHPLELVYSDVWGPAPDSFGRKN